MSDLEKFTEMLDKANIPYRKDSYTMFDIPRRIVRWVTVFDPSGEPIDFRFSDIGDLESIATEVTP